MLRACPLNQDLGSNHCTPTPIPLLSHVLMVCRIPDAKNLKLRHTRGMSTTLASQTGFPWSRDSASANSSSRDSTKSAIWFIRRDRSFAGVLDHLIYYRVRYPWKCDVVKAWKCPQIARWKGKREEKEGKETGGGGADIDGFQIPIKRPISGWQTCHQEAAVQRIFHLQRTSFFYLSAIMVRTWCSPFLVLFCTQHHWAHIPTLAGSVGTVNSD